MSGVEEAIISVVLSLAVNKAASFAAKEFAKLSGVGGNIRVLTSRLLMINAFLADAEAKQTENGALRLWLAQLKDVAYDIEDLLEECATEVALRPEGLAGGVGQRGILQWKRRARDGFYLVSDCFLSCCVSNPTPVSFRRRTADRLRSFEKRLDRMEKDRSLLGLVALGNQPKTTRRRETTPLREEGSLFVGREDKIAEIKRELFASVEKHESSSSTVDGEGRSFEGKISVVAIVGFGGIGKTTLAQSIFNDEEVKANFTMREWVFVGEDFDAKRLIRGIVSDGDAKSAQSLHDLQESLKLKVSDHRSLIILDDVWNNNPQDWDPLWAPLTHAKKGSVILVTTRRRDVAVTKGPASVYELGGLSDEECWRIFEGRAFQGERSKQYRRQVELGRKMVEKVKGVPLAASMLGGFLGTHLHDEKKWEWVLNSTICPQTREGALVDQVIDLSYQHLPSHLKLCFTYCAIFPKDFRFDKEKLVQMWIAQNYVKSQEGRQLEDVGSDHFGDLHQSCFFQYVNDEYVMHDMIHDYAQKVFTECEQGNARHLSLSCHRLRETHIENISKLDKLRTLRLNCAGGAFASYAGLFAKFRYLRVLELRGYEVSEFPESIRCLKLLKYLDIRQTGIRRLPERVACNLCNLQTLRVGYGCADIQSVNKLVNLRHLHGNEEHISKVRGLGKLTSLQVLELFHVTKDDGRKIAELKGLNSLRGSLAIRGLENVESMGEVEMTRLEDKVHLEGLELRWDARQHRDGMLDGEVLEGLRPPPNVKQLRILFNVGINLPSWMNEEQHQLSALAALHLRGCSKWERLPSLGRLPCLKELMISGANRVKKVGREFYGIGSSAVNQSKTNNNNGEDVLFPSLEMLHISEMPEWEVWEGGVSEEQEGARGGGVVSFPCLQNLNVWSCPNLQELPEEVRRKLFTLSSLHIRSCEQLESMGPLESLLDSSIKSLSILGCPKLMAAAAAADTWTCSGELDTITSGHHPSSPSPPPLMSSSSTLLPFPSAPWRLQRLSIDDGWLLGRLLLHSQKTNALTSLESLEIWSCDELVFFTEAEGEGLRQLVSLSLLFIGECKNLRCLPPVMQKLSSLRGLWLVRCPRIQCLPEGGLPPLLQILEIQGCPLLKERCRDGGPDHPAIHGVPHVSISMAGEGVEVPGAGRL